MARKYFSFDVSAAYCGLERVSYMGPRQKLMKLSSNAFVASRKALWSSKRTHRSPPAVMFDMSYV